MLRQKARFNCDKFSLKRAMFLVPDGTRIFIFGNIQKVTTEFLHLRNKPVFRTVFHAFWRFFAELKVLSVVYCFTGLDLNSKTVTLV